MGLTGTYIGNGTIRWEISGFDPNDFDYFEVVTSDGFSATSSDPILYTGEHEGGQTVTGEAWAYFGGAYYIGSASVYIPPSTMPPIGAPLITNLEALYENGQHKIRITWDSMDVIGEIEGYRIWANGVYKGWATSSPYTIFVDYEYTLYQIEIRAFNSAGESDPGFGSIRTKDVTPPSIDTFSIGNIQQTAAVVSFSASDTGSGVDRYELYLNGALYISRYYASDIITLSPLQPATTYGVLLIVYDKSGNSNYVYDTFTTQGVPVDPPAPLTGLTGQHVGGGTVNISWNPSQGATRYKIWYGSSSSPVVEVFVTGTSYTATGLMLNELYVFVVTPYNGDVAGEGASVQIPTGPVGPRPSNFVWQNTIIQDPIQEIDHTDWNNLTAKVNQFLVYKGKPIRSFQRAVQGEIGYASFFNEVRDAILSMNPPIQPPAPVKGISEVGKDNADPVTAAQLSGLANSLNSIP